MGEELLEVRFGPWKEWLSRGFLWTVQKIYFLNYRLSYLVICKVFKSHNRTPASEEQAIVFPSNWRRGWRWIFDSNGLRVPRHFSLSWASDQTYHEKNTVRKGLVECLHVIIMRGLLHKYDKIFLGCDFIPCAALKFAGMYSHRPQWRASKTPKWQRMWNARRLAWRMSIADFLSNFRF